MNEKQTQGTMTMVGALAATVGLVAFVAMMVIGGMSFAGAFGIALAIFLIVAVVLMIGFHRRMKPAMKVAAPAAAPAPAPAPAPAAAAPSPAPAPEPAPEVETAPPEPAPAPAAPGKPQTLSAPKDGGADDLKKIKGVGPKLEKLLHSMGFYHYDQIAAWSADEVAWVDENLEGFKGRVTRDGWVDQAKTLATGAETAFSKKVDEGGVY
ncbi:MAG: NADH:ubiquinone oxidoreductase [Pseudomonadota bacterium]